jgi:hypothetical protein
VTPKSTVAQICFSPSNFIQDERKKAITVINDKETDTIHIRPNEPVSPELLGLDVKAIIESASLGQVINLPDCHIKIPELYILKPLTIKGKPGTILEITHGSIVVDFDREEKYKDVLAFCECHIVFSDRADLIII